MSETFLLIPGRTSRQGTSLNEGKYTAEYLDEISSLQVSAGDMTRLGLADGDKVRVWNQMGEIEVTARSVKADELPAGLLFISYGEMSSRLMSGDTHCSGMPDSKMIEVQMEKAAPKSGG